jgi:hypothetical protein
MNNEWSNLRPSKRNLEKKTLSFILFGTNKIRGQFGTVIRNGTPSCDSTPIFKMLKGLGNKSSH